MILTDRRPPAWRAPRPRPSPLPPRLRVPVLVDPWAEALGLELIGTQQDANDIYYDGFDPTLTVDPILIDSTEWSYQKAMEWLKLLPSNILRAFEPQYNNYTKIMETKAIYFSTAPNRGYALIMPRNYSSVLRDIYPGFILERERSPWSRLALHEYGHVVDLIGTNRQGYYWQPIWDLADNINSIFDATGDLISDYAKTSSTEDFAEHFAYYVWSGMTFRNLAGGNPDLTERYDFLRNQLFFGVEYETWNGGVIRAILYVRVRSVTGYFLEGAHIIVNINGSTYEGYTDASGTCIIDVYEEGVASYVIKKEGFLPASGTVNLEFMTTRYLTAYMGTTMPPPPEPPEFLPIIIIISSTMIGLGAVLSAYGS